MSGADEVQVTVVVKEKKLPNIKKITHPKCEQLHCDFLEVVSGSGVVHECHEIKEFPANPWIKLHNELWDKSVGVLRGCESYEGSKRAFCTKKKVFSDMLPAFAS